MAALNELLKDIQIVAHHGELECQIKGIHYDSRKVESDYLFLCIKGFKSDGHDFIDQAIANGAIAVLVEEEVESPPGVTIVQVNNTRRALPIISGNYYGHPANKFNLIGVTGTNGKTTTTFLLEAILKEWGQKVGLIGTIENRIGEQAFPVVHTTPESLDLQKMFDLMVTERVDYGVMEVSSHALDLGRVDRVEYDVAVFTNLTQDHLDYHPDMEHYLQAKSILFSGLGETNHKNRQKYGVINGDDPYSDRLVANAKVPIITYGIKSSNDVVAQNVEVTAAGVSFTINYWDGQFTLLLKITGLFSVYNALAATTVALKEGVKPEEIKKALESLTGVAGRFESVNAGQDFSVVVDYAHTPDSLENILITAKEFVKGRIITVFGCGGDRDRGKRPLMGEKAALYSDICIITSDNPRTEEPEQIIKDIIPGIEKHMKIEQYEVVENRREAIEKALRKANKNDMVIIAGKGHETYQIIKDKVYLFDDRQVAKEALEKIGHDGT